jgi:hypothetical protein
MIKRLIIWSPDGAEMRVPINRMIKSLLVTMLIDSALTLLGPLNSTVPDAATVDPRRGPDDTQRKHMETYLWVQ